MNAFLANPRFAFLPLTIFFAFLCSGSRAQPRRIDFSGKNTDIHMNISQVGDSVIYIPMQLPDSITVSQGTDICLADLYILVKDRPMKQVLLLSRDGQFIRRISGNGIGLGEYTSFWDATLDEAGDRIFILDSRKRLILVYSLHNEFIGIINVENEPIHLAALGHERLLAIRPYEGKDQSQLPHLYQLGYDGTVLQKTFLKEEAEHQDFTSFAQLYRYKDSLCLYQTEADTIFCIGQDGVVTPRYILTDKEMFPTVYRHSLELIQQNFGSWFVVHNVFETPRYLFFNGAYKARRRGMIYDKVTGQLNNVVYNTDRGMMDDALQNDIDGGMPFWPTGQANEKYLYAILDPGKFRDIALSDYNKSLPFKDTVQHAKMLDILSHTTGYGNPIIQLIRTK